jgi:hypothetical protein
VGPTLGRAISNFAADAECHQHPKEAEFEYQRAVTTMARHSSKKPHKQTKLAVAKKKTGRGAQSSAKHPPKAPRPKPSATEQPCAPPAGDPPPPLLATTAAPTAGAPDSAAVPHTHPLDPPHAARLGASHDLHVIPIAASSSIEAKVARVLALLRAEPPPPQADGAAREKAEKAPGERRPVLAALVARAPAANKCVGVAEIAKRELRRADAEGGPRTCCQHTGMWTRLEEAAALAAGAADAEDGAASDSVSDVAFESPERKKVRGMPCLVVYLALEPVAVLQKAYG